MVRVAAISRRFLVLMCALTMAFAICEVAARTYSWSIGRGFWSRPNAFESAFFTTYDWPAPLIRGEYGTFRDGVTVPRAKPQGELRVICIGGSTTVNDDNPEGVVQTRLLEERLRTRIPSHDVRVLNAGGDGFSSAHSLVNFSLRLLDFQPDVVVVLDHVNDMTALDYGDDFQPDYSNKYLSESFLAYEHRLGIGGTLLRLSRGLQLVRWRLSLLQNVVESSPRNGYRHDPQRGRQIFRRNLDSMAALARQHGVRIILLTMGHRDDEQGLFASYNEEIRRAGQANQVAVVDLARVMSGHADLFVDAVHMSARGVITMADAIEPVLEATLREQVGANPPGQPQLR